jgi:hypothetical protein
MGGGGSLAQDPRHTVRSVGRVMRSIRCTEPVTRSPTCCPPEHTSPRDPTLASGRKEPGLGNKNRRRAPRRTRARPEIPGGRNARSGIAQPPTPFPRDISPLAQTPPSLRRLAIPPPATRDIRREVGPSRRGGGSRSPSMRPARPMQSEPFPSSPPGCRNALVPASQNLPPPEPSPPRPTALRKFLRRR